MFEIDITVPVWLSPVFFVKKLGTITLMNDKEKTAKIINNINSLSEIVSTLEDTTLKAEFTAIINQASIKMERATQPSAKEDDEWKDFLRNKERCIAP
jgi:hypothetical protein